MSRLIEELKRKYQTPQQAMAALGLDAALLTLSADAVVGDSKEGLHMPTGITLSRKAAMVMGGLYGLLKPKLAADAQIAWPQVLGEITSKNYTDLKPKLEAGLKEALKGKLAKDANLDDMHEFMDRLDKAEPAEDEEAPPMKPAAEDEAETEEEKKVRMDKRAKDKKAAMDEEETAEEKAERMKARDAKRAKDAKAAKDAAEEADKDKVTKPAMDAALKAHGAAVEAATIARLNAIADARELVRPYVGALAGAYDSAEAVHRAALGVMKVDVAKDVHASALPHIIKAQPLPDGKKPTVFIAADAAHTKSYYERFPGAEHIGAL